MKRKIFSLFLILIMAMVFSPIVHAETNKPDGAEWLVDKGENHVWYKIEGTTLTIGGSGAMPNWKSGATVENSYSTAPWYGENIMSIIIAENDNVTKIGEYAFVSCESLVSVKLAQSVETIGTGAFRGCSKLNTIEFNDTLKYIDPGAFNGCAFTSLTFPEGLEKIGGMAFQYNDKLTKIVLPSSLKEIQMSAFYMNNVNALKEITSYRKDALTLGANVFKNVNIDKLTIPSGSDYSSWSIYDEKNVSYLYTVTFDTNGGNEIKSVMVEQNNKLVKPTNPTKTGYAFDGWYIDDSLKNPFDFDTIITADTTLYAKWALLHNVIVTVNDQSMGEASANYTSAIKGTQISLTATPNNGYHFVKWESEDVDASTGKFEMIDKDISVKAIFEKDEVKTYKVSFNANGGSGTMSDVSGLTGTYKLLANEFTAPAGKQFKGWSLSSDGVIITELDMTEDKTVYAIWEDIPKNYDYEIIKGDNQTLIINKFDEFTFTINGDYSLFVSVKIGNLELVRDEDYIVTEGSTIITFTKSGIAKLNSLENGEYEIIVNYSNDKIATGSLYVNKENPVEPSDPEDEPDVEPDKKKDEQKEIPEENPETSDNVGIYLTVGSISFISLIGCVIYTKRKRLRA